MSKNWNKIGDELLAEGRLEEALMAFEKAREELPDDNPWPACNIGRVHLQAEKYDLAKEWLAKALHVDPDMHEALYAMAVLYLKRDDTASAKAYLWRAIKLEPSNPKCHFMLGDCLLAEGDYYGAILEYQLVVRRSTKSFWGYPSAYCNMGSAYYRLAIWEDALNAYLAAFRVQPANENFRERVMDAVKRLVTETENSFGKPENRVNHDKGAIITRLRNLGERLLHEDVGEAAELVFSRLNELAPENTPGHLPLDNAQRYSGIKNICRRLSRRVTTVL